MIVWKPFRGGSYSHVFHMGVGHQNRLWFTEEELKMHVRLGNIPPVPPIMVNKFLDDLNNSANP